MLWCESRKNIEMDYGEKKQLICCPTVYTILVRAETPLSQKRYEELSTTIPLWGSKAASVWQKNNPAPFIKDEELV